MKKLILFNVLAQIQYQFKCLSLIKIKKNHMTFQISSLNSQQIISKFDKLVDSVAYNQRTGLNVITHHRFNMEIQKCSEVQVKNMLYKLIEKYNINEGRKNWKIEETNYLLYIIDKYCLVQKCDIEQLDLSDWEEISKLVPGRNGTDCKFKYLSLTPTNVSNSPWSVDERNILLKMIEKEDQRKLNWKQISKKLYELSQKKIYRTGKQCKEHFTCFLNPNLKKGAWTEQQDYQLILLFLKFGKKWSKMTNFIKGRNQNSIKNRFFLMFENKKQIQLSNSQLVKLVRRRKQKLQKKFQLIPQDFFLQNEQNLNMTLTIADSNIDSSQNRVIDTQNQDNREIQESINEIKQDSKHMFYFQHKQSFFQQGFFEQYERYIDF